jgi:TolA-binding protein
MLTHKTTLAFILLFSGTLLLGQTGNSGLFYDIGLVIEDTNKTALDTLQVNTLQGALSQEQLELEEELDRYQHKLVETEIRLRHQTMVIDSLQTEITQIKAAGETDKALLSTRITNLVDQQSKPAQAATQFDPSRPASSDSVFAELHTPWKNTTVTTQPLAQVQTEPKLSTAEEQAAYRTGLTKFHQQYYYQAIDEFNTIVNRSTDVTLQANAQYWVGRCYFEKGLYDQAISTLEQVQRYQHSDKLDDALVMIGLAFKNKDRLPEAKLAFQELVSRHPGSEYLTLAKRFVQE